MNSEMKEHVPVLPDHGFAAGKTRNPLEQTELNIYRFKINILDLDIFVGCFLYVHFLYRLFWYRLFAC